MKLIYWNENLNGCLQNGLQLLRRAKKLLFGMQESMRSNNAFFSKKESKMEIIAASMRETNLTYPNILSETFKQSMYAK